MVFSCRRSDWSRFEIGTNLLRFLFFSSFSSATIGKEICLLDMYSSSSMVLFSLDLLKSMRSNNGPLKLFVGDLGDNRKSDLNHLFSKYGEITTIYFDEIKRFAFVEFTSSNDAQRALERTNNKTVNGSKLRVEYAKSDKPSRDHRPRDRSPTSMLYSHLQVRVGIFRDSMPFEYR